MGIILSEQRTAVGTASQSWVSPDADAIQSGVDTDTKSGTDDARGLGQKLRVGQRVVTRNGQRGLVFRLLRDPQSHLITCFVVLTRPLLGRELVVPIELVVEVTRNRVSLKVDASELDRLPVYRTDQQIDRDVERALSMSEDLRHSGRVLLEVSVRDGVVTLRGYVPSGRSQGLASEVSTKTQGVRGLRDQLVADDDLEVRVARALADDARTRPYIIRVHCHFGIAHLTGTLEGTVASAETQVIAQEIAANVAGVRLALAELDGRSPEDRASPVLPGVGLPVYTTDGHLGRLELVVMSSRSRRVTHLVVGDLPQVESSDQPPDSGPETRRLLIPAVAVARVTEYAILLSLDRATADRLPAYSGDGYRVPDSDWQPTFDYSRADVRCPVEATSTRQAERPTVEAAAA